MSRVFAALLVCGALIGCRSSPRPDEAHASPVVARAGDLEITAADLDARILSLPAADRPRPGADLDAWYEEQIRQIAVEQRLREEARAAKLDESEAFASARRDAEKQIAVQLCLAGLLPDAERVSEEDLRAAYAARATSLSLPERRSTRHLFLRGAAGASRTAARHRIEGLRDRVLAGESFRVLAAEYSDSESRHQEGSLGFVVRGQLPAGFEEVVFALEEGVPSEPVVTRDGVHLFYVEQILPAREFDYDEARATLRERLIAERREAAISRIVAEIGPQPDSLVPDQENLLEVATSGDARAVVLKVGDEELTVGELRRRVRHSREVSSSEGSLPLPALTRQVLERWRRREVLYEHCRTSGAIPDADLAAQLEKWDRAALPALQRQRRMLELVQRDQGRLRLFYDSNAGLFSTPPRWHVRRLRLPLDDHASATMARLEAAARSRGRLDDLHAALGGEIDDLGSQPLAELRRLEPKLPRLVAPLRTGQLSAPYRTEDAISIVEVVERVDAEARAYDDVREEVAAAYVGRYAHEVYGALAEEIVGTDELTILPGGLAAVRQTGVAELGTGAEEIEAGLDGR